jgi:hypothetical protein
MTSITLSDILTIIFVLEETGIKCMDPNRLSEGLV